MAATPPPEKQKHYQSFTGVREGLLEGGHGAPGISLFIQRAVDDSVVEILGPSLGLMVRLSLDTRLAISHPRAYFTALEEFVDGAETDRVLALIDKKLLRGIKVPMRREQVGSTRSLRSAIPWLMSQYSKGTLEGSR